MLQGSGCLCDLGMQRALSLCGVYARYRASSEDLDESGADGRGQTDARGREADRASRIGSWIHVLGGFPEKILQSSQDFTRAFRALPPNLRSVQSDCAALLADPPEPRAAAAINPEIGRGGVIHPLLPLRAGSQRFGMTSDCPGRMRVPDMPLARWIAETEDPLRLAMAERESPFFTT